MAIWHRKTNKSFEPVSAQQVRRGRHGETGPRVGDLTVGDYANGMPNIRLGEMFKSFMGQMLWLGPLLVIGWVIAWYATADFKPTYSGDGRILVQLGEEYVYNPIGQAANGNGLSTTIDTITLTESAIMKNGEIIDQVIGEMTPDRRAQDRLAKEAFEKIRTAPTEQERRIAQMELRNEIANAYLVMPQPKSSIIDVSFKHEDPDVAVEVTNAFIDAYLTFRRQVFVEGSSDIITERREATESQLMANERAIARFLKNKDISDFTSEQEGLRERTEDLKASLNETRATIAETEAALARVEDQLRATPDTIDLYRDDRAAQRVSQAELELRQLMAKYLPTSDPVRQKQTELNELRALQSSYGGKASGGRRVGPNPTHQALLTRRNTLASTADSVREKEFTLQRQLNSADGKIRRLTSLTPEYQNLVRERETLNVRLTSYNAKEQEALVDSQQAESTAENIKVISYAKYPNKGRNMRLLMFALAALGWGIFLFFAGLIRVFLDPRLYAVPGAPRRAYAEPDLIEAVPDYDPIPEPIPAYDPVMPVSPDPYGVPAAPAYGYAAPEQQIAAYQDTAYQVPAPEYGATAYADSYAPPAQPQFEAGYADPRTPPYRDNTAIDLSHNPYLSGEVEAGAIQHQPVQQSYTGYVDQYGNPVPPYTG